METSLAHENARLRALLQTQQDTIRQMAEYNRLLSQRVAAYASEINRLKALVAKLQRMQFGKSSEKLRAKTERQIQEAQERISALQEEMAETLGEQCHPPCASLQPVNHYRPHFPVKPGLSGRKINAARPVVVTSVLWDVMCQSNWSLSAAPLRLSKHNVRNWPAACAIISCRHRFLQNPLHAVMPERGFWPMLSPENMQTICRYTASQKYTVVRELSRATLGRWTGAVAELLEPLYDVLRQYVLMPGKVHADDIPFRSRNRAVVKQGLPGCGSTSVMTVTPVHRCPRRSGSRTHRTGKVSIHRIIWPVTAVCFRPMLTVVTGCYTNPAE